MLDTETKRRIDTARDILVGKVPDPKSQVEQITIALIYKFMDDMDSQAEELGGKRKFFTKEFAQYGWAKLMAPSVSGEERITLYGEGMVKMPQNPGVPQLFRNIFKNAYLPYRDPETLKLFLKTINEFEYDHSERLGDAYEYLVSILGSQGDAGQFRTPRHIIDFMVSIVDPKKNETMLDPACGTAGFMIAAYKHVLATNTGKGGKRGDQLTPDERKKLADSFRGYDIDPGMVRLALANMYLHGFTDPHVFEYDTLTSQDRWNEMADVIIANPPFMSPKGGIKPHNRFSVPSKRSEVLFVDYMAEHLTPAGRAGVVVPQGILSDPTKAASSLRSMLVDRFQIDAIITLPAGCFRPYADAETAVLIFSKGRGSADVWFYEVSYDGFSLDDRRTPISDNDIPDLLQRWPEREESAKSFRVPVSEIKARGNILALGEYKKDHLAVDQQKLPPGWKVHRLSKIVREVAERAGGGHGHPVLSVTKYDGFVPSADYFKKRIFSDDTSSYKVVKKGQFAYSTIHLDEGAIGYLENLDAGIISPMYKVFELVVGEEVVHPLFLYRLLKSDTFLQRYRAHGKGSVKRRKSVAFDKFAAVSIAVPPAELQRELVGHLQMAKDLESKLRESLAKADEVLARTLQLAGLG